ncbi:MAG: YicC family protein [Clostridiales bacterium]|nr:YicC family protein [Clostridiales bacterium]
MLKSMTGYGRQETMTEGRKILVEIRSVNQRFSDYNIKVPRYMGFLEDKIRSFVSEGITRGKVDIFVNVENFSEADKEISLNEPLAKNYIEVLRELRDKFDLKDDISVSLAAGFNDIFRTQRVEEDQDEIWSLVKPVLSDAMDSFIAMREREGERIEKDLTARIEYMRTLARKIDERSPQTVSEYRERLYNKIRELLENREPDEGRLLTEVAIFADKVAVNEETVRLESHFEEFNNIINAPEPAGRKLDFIIQEINREVNTIGSKAQDIEIAKLVVTLKGEIEKLREQVQNIE